MKIFKKPVQAIFKASQPPLKAEDVIEIAYQGCTEGFCYPPEVKEIKSGGFAYCPGYRY